MSHNPKMSGGVGYIGSKISLISRSDIRYVGILHSINSADSTVALEQVRSYGTEGRKGNPAEEIPQSDNVFEYIVFRGSDVKDLHVCEAPAQQATMPPQVPNDPAILGTTAPVRPQYQQFAPPPLGVQPPPNFPAAPINPFYLQQAAAAAFQQQHQQSPAYWPPHPQPPQINLADNVSKEAEQPKPQQQKEHPGPEKPEDHKLDGTALSNKNLLSKSGPNVRQNIGHPVSIRNEVAKDVASSVAVEKLAKKVSELNVQPKEANGDVQPSRNYERPSHNNNNSSTSRNNNDNRPSSNNRLPGMGGHLVQVNRRRAGRRSYSQSYDRNRIPVPASDFDFESSNAKFNKDELVKEVVKKIHPNHESKEEETVEAHTTEEDEEEEDANSEPFYDRSKSFFDNISCETKERLEQQGPDGRRGLSVAERRQKQSEERRLNLETFGQVSIDGGRYRGRGYRGYRGSRGGYRGSYSSNYRGGSAYRGSRGSGGSGVGGNYRSNQNS